MTIPSPELQEITKFLKAGQKEKAVDLLRQILTHNPRNVQALTWLGGLTTHVREGVLALERAVKLDPDNKTAKRYLNRLRVLQVSGKLVDEGSKQTAQSLGQLKSHRLAILFDGDNARPALLSKIMREAKKYGALRIKRIYGDWTRPGMNGWKRVLQTHAIQPIQQFQYTSGKNSTDSALIIDAMDILHSGQVDGFCLVSSDSDYTRLATRISESSLFVMGIGKRRTPKAFIRACDVFIYTNDLLIQPPVTKAASSKPAQASVNHNGTHEADMEVVSLLNNAFDRAAQSNGRAYLGTMGIHLQRIQPSFEPRKYGHKQLSQLIKAHSSHFEIEMVSSKVYVKRKNGKS